MKFLSSILCTGTQVIGKFYDRPDAHKFGGGKRCLIPYRSLIPGEGESALSSSGFNITGKLSKPRTNQ